MSREMFEKQKREYADRLDWINTWAELVSRIERLLFPRKIVEQSTRCAESRDTEKHVKFHIFLNSILVPLGEDFLSIKV